jgi:cytochrome c oxidase assembly protein subunit 15
MFKKIVLVTACLAFIVVVVGAFVRLSDAGLGCPDWPGCYGHMTVPDQPHALARADQAYPNRPVEPAKAWKEMGHRYLAGTLGLLILIIAIIAWRKRRALAQSPVLPTVIVFLVILQAALGMWTVTLLLKPVIVTLHLIGGMATLALLAWLALRQWQPAAGVTEARRRSLRPWIVLGLVVLIAQMILGGWVSTNYAALACTDFPTCHGTWVPQMDFRHGFQLVRGLGVTASGAPLSYQALTAIHWTHRVGALVTFVYLSALALALLVSTGARRYGAALLVLVVLQVALGISNVVFSLPLPIAVAHNAGAALLLVTLVVLNYVFSRRRPFVS